MKQLPWTLCMLAVALVAWLALAVVNVENQRHALASKACAETDAQCLASVRTREHWWQHLTYAMTHFRPSRTPDKIYCASCFAAGDAHRLGAPY